MLAHLARDPCDLTAIIATHHHADHIGGTAGLLTYAKVPVFGPANESIPQRTRALGEGDRIDVDGIGSFQVFDVPGHTAGHIAYFGDFGGPVLFCGDTLFTCGCGRLFEGTAAQLHSSLMKLATLPAETRVFCGHEYTISNLRFALAVEPQNAALVDRQKRAAETRARNAPTVPSTMGEERATNPFLRASEPSVRAAAERHAGRPLADPVAVFAELRAWKDAF